MRPRQILFSPALASLLRHRPTTLVITAFVALQVGLTAVQIPFWSCPAMAATGQPCPGCGLTRAAVALLKLDFAGMAQLHLFAPMLMLALALIFLAAVLPVRARDLLVNGVERVERATGVTNLLLIAFVLYWIARMCFDRQSLVALLTS